MCEKPTRRSLEIARLKAPVASVRCIVSLELHGTAYGSF